MSVFFPLFTRFLADVLAIEPPFARNDGRQDARESGKNAPGAANPTISQSRGGKAACGRPYEQIGAAAACQKTSRPRHALTPSRNF
jgi:hypothetical protein